MTMVSESRPERPAKGKRKSFLLRINEDLWNELSEWASQEFRSVNGQVEVILRRAVDERKKIQRNRRSKDKGRF